MRADGDSEQSDETDAELADVDWETINPLEEDSGQEPSRAALDIRALEALGIGHHHNLYSKSHLHNKGQGIIADAMGTKGAVDIKGHPGHQGVKEKAYLDDAESSVTLPETGDQNFEQAQKQGGGRHTGEPLSQDGNGAHDREPPKNKEDEARS